MAENANLDKGEQSEKGSETQIIGNVHGPVLSGQFYGPIVIESEARVAMLIPCQIPPPPKDFTGRIEEVQDLISRFDKGATMTGLQGMGGTGKTALALVIAEKVKDRFPDGQIFIEMRGASKIPLSPTEAMAHVIRAYHPTAKMPEDLNCLEGLYRSVLSGKRTLLLLDNAANREQVDSLLPPKSCSILITSRQKFTLPGLKARNMNLLPPADSRDLLLSIADRIGDQADNIANLCGYLPIALRNAASLLAERIDVGILEYAQKLTEAKTRLDLVDATFSLSYDLLPPDLQKNWSMLAVFPSDFDRSGAAAVWKIEMDAAARSLSDLVKWSLVDFNPSDNRYRLHDLARDFAMFRLDGASWNTTCQRHSEHFGDVLSRADELYMKGGEKILAGLELFDLEWPNIQAGQIWAEKNLECDHSAANLCRMYYSTGVYVLSLRLDPVQKISWNKAGIRASRCLGDKVMEVDCLDNLGIAHAELGDAKNAIAYHHQSLIIYREIGNRRGESIALGHLGNAYADLCDYRKAIEYYEQQLSIDREIGYQRGEGIALSNLGLVYLDLGDARSALDYFKQYLTITWKMEDKKGEGTAMCNIGLACAKLGYIEMAIEYYKQALAIDREIKYQWGETADLVNLGNAYIKFGNIRMAMEHFQMALMINRKMGDRRAEGTILNNLGNVCAQQGDMRNAIKYFQKALVIGKEIGDRRGEGNALVNISLSLDELGQRAQAIESAKSALEIYEQIESPIAERVKQKLAEWQKQ
jgi:tetratricopeptide (TPR) repeat protein